MADGNTDRADAAREAFQPLGHTGPTDFRSALRFRARLLLDFQVLTVYRDMRSFVPRQAGRVLDVGCGESPYRHLVDEGRAHYVGIDIADSDKFGYDNREIVRYDGCRMPLPDDSVDAVICSEVLEHVEHPQQLVDEIRRTLKPGGSGLVTVPWSARYHYVPHDYYRYTPTTLKKMFGAFKAARVEPRGSDITVIAAKIIVAFFRMVGAGGRVRWHLLPLALLLAPVAAAAVLLGHLSLAAGLGTDDDPLGYSVWIEK